MRRGAAFNSPSNLLCLPDQSSFNRYHDLFFGFTNMTRGDQACCRISSVSMEEFMKFVSNEEYGVDSQPFMVICGNNRHMLAQMVRHPLRKFEGSVCQGSDDATAVHRAGDCSGADLKALGKKVCWCATAKPKSWYTSPNNIYWIITMTISRLPMQPAMCF